MMNIDQQKISIPVKIKKSLPALIRRHVLLKKKLDIFWCVGVLNM